MLVPGPTRAISPGTNRIGSAVLRGPTGARLDATFQKGRIRPLIRKTAGILAGILFPMLALAVNANAVQIITNGGFELPSPAGLTGWTVTSSATSGGSWFPDSGTATPDTFNPTVGPHSGTGYAVTDQFGPGVNALSQGYTVPVGTTSLTLTGDMFVNDWNSSTGTANVQVLVLAAGADPVTGVGTVLTTQDILVTGGAPNPYAAFNFAITGFVPGNSYILDFRETDTVANMNVGVDDVARNAVVTVVPAPVIGRGLPVALAVFGLLFGVKLLERNKMLKLLSLLAGIALLGQPAYAQSANVAHALVPSASLQPEQSRPYIWILSILDPAAVVHGPGDANCGGGSGQDSCFYFPADINTAYTTAGISSGNGGAGRTVAITDAFFNSETEADLIQFSSDFGLPACTIANGCLTIVGQTGGAPPAQQPGPPFADGIAGWFGEEDLDVQWVHAIAPNAKILLVIANSSSNADLYQAVQYAKAHADVVTNSWGAPEFSTETSFDSTFSSTVPILFSSGDAFASRNYPCASPNATCVGGTKLLETATSYRNVESVWNETANGDGGTGGGCSQFESEPAFQTGFSTCGSQRGMPDIAAIADPFTGVAVFLGNNATNGGGAGLTIIGGTSLASPVMAAIVADIDASRVAHGKAILGGSAPFNLASRLYPGAVSPFYHYRYYDVTTGTNAAAGWDTATGLGVTLNPALTAYLNSLP